LSNTPTVVYKFPFSSIEKEEKPENKKIVKKKKKRDLYETFLFGDFFSKNNLRLKIIILVHQKYLD